MSLDTQISVTITRASKNPTRKGFGIPLLGVSKVPAGWGTAKVRTFGDTQELLDLGFTVNDPAYKMAALLKAQNPAPKQFKIGKRSLPPTKSVKLTVVNITVGYVYSFYVDGTLITYTVPGSPTTSSVATALAALIDALPNVSASAVSAVITISAAAGTIFDVKNWRGNTQVPGGDSQMTLEDATTDPGIATDLAAWRAADADWYAYAVDSMGKLEQIAAAAWTASQSATLGVLDAADSEILNPGDTDDACSTVKALTNDRAVFFVSTENLLHWSSCAILGSRLPAAPGSDTWKWKSLTNVTPSNMTEGEQVAVLAKNGNFYVSLSGLGLTMDGKCASGEFVDVIRFIDWLKATMQADLLTVLASAEKIPFTDAGVDIVKGVVFGTLTAGVKVGGLANDPAPNVEAPLVADVSLANRQNRILPDVVFTGKLAGAIHYANVKGTISV